MASSRKALRKEARKAKNKLKAENFMRVRKRVKIPVKAPQKLSRESRASSQVLASSIAFEPIPRTRKKRKTHKTASKGHLENDVISGDPLLAFADMALEKGILKSDGEFDEDAMNGLFTDSESQCSSKDHDLDQEREGETIKGTESEQSLSLVSHQSIPKDACGSNDEKLKRLIQGHFNRLSTSNFESIALSMARELRAYSSTQFIEAFCANLCGFLVAEPNLLDSYILNYVALTAALVYCVGTDLVGCVLEELVAELDQRRRIIQDAHTTDSQRSDHSRVVMNVMTALSFLYDLQIISRMIILDLISECIGGIENEHEVEGLVRLIRLCGAQLRREDPTALKHVISLIQEKTQGLHMPSQSSRFKFMLDVVQDLKNNRQKLVAIQHGDLENVKKLLRSFQQTRGSSKIDALNVSLSDIREAKSKGKWWRIGAAWKGREKVETARPLETEHGGDPQLLKIAKGQHMNTDVRRAIFGALMTSEDCNDAFRKLLALRLASRQEREIVHVILHCLCQEKVYNPYYSLVATKFISTRHNFEITFKYALWDRLTLIQKGEIRPRGIVHLASFYGTLIARRLLPLASLCKVPFAELCNAMPLFLRILFKTLFEQVRLDIDITIVFGDIEQISRRDKGLSEDLDGFGGRDLGDHDEQLLHIKRLELANFKSGLKMFFRQNFDAIASLSQEPCILSRIECAWRALNQ